MQGIDIFAGAGGMSTAAEYCGIKVKYAVENELNAANTFRRNHSDVKVIQDDIRNVDAKKAIKGLSKQDELILFGGPPCQGFSTSNQKNRNYKNEKNWLFEEYLRFLTEIRPDWLLFENVKGLIETEGGYFLDSVLEGFKNLGYTTNHYVLNAADYGVPQNRNRLFIVGSLHGITASKPPQKRGKKVTVADALMDLPIVSNGNSIDEQHYSSIAKTTYARTMRGKLATCRNNTVTSSANHIIERYRHIPQGGNWKDIPDELMGNYKDKTRCHTGIYRRLTENEPSTVIGNFRKNMLIHPWKDRGLSVREAARLQSFPDHFEFKGSIGFQQQQVGNAVPPLLARAVFKTIISE
jgi:DNA (cytosine-5)-methyltransferase 1